MNLLTLSCVVLLGCLGCGSNQEALRKNLTVRTPSRVSVKVPEAAEDFGKLVDDCLSLGDRQLPGAFVEVLSPVLELDSFKFRQPNFQFALHERSPSKSPQTYELGFLIGHIVITSPNDASLDLMDMFQARTNKWVQKARPTSWRLSWHLSESQTQTWATNALLLQVADAKYAAAPIDWLSYTAPVLYPSNRKIDGLVVRPMVISRSFAERLISPDFAGEVTFDPKVVGLAQHGKLVACVPAQIASAK